MANAMKFCLVCSIFMTGDIGADEAQEGSKLEPASKVDDARRLSIKLSLDDRQRPIEVEKGVDPPARRFHQLERIKINYKITLGKLSGIDHIIILESYPIIHEAKIRVFLKGVEVPKTRYFLSDECSLVMSRTKLRTLSSGSTHRGSFIANLLFDMTTPGTYTIEFEGLFPENLDLDDDPRRAKAESLTVEVRGAPL
jgi:hypothetical protein